ncbi:acyl carrier protein [Dyadobacter flavalbus]|uniref:Acyl carrier protein n=3 Tax=Spirosomataceae TaxID=2896860 RepID=A0A5R9KKV0_9BACT|nr:phosphopantetheine-binding protein [Dyadobacter sediminis]KAA6441300.1 acyl carrier protein [Dyadobacter flavalbus]TLU96835.1 acyl carrier protein [Dyadobacter sediminis]GGB85533.1 acyl carrier protein [Dyadobacter sediminis]
MYINDVKMNWEEVIEETRDFLSEEFEIDRNLILPENNLKDTLDLDSLDYVDLVVLIEENLNIKITGEDFKEIVTFGDFFKLVRKKLAL